MKNKTIKANKINKECKRYVPSNSFLNFFFFNFFFLILFYYFRKSNVTFNNLSLNAGVKILSHIYGGDYLLPAEDLFPLAVAADLYDIPTLTSTTVAKLAEQCHFWHLPCGSVVSVHERE